MITFATLQEKEQHPQAQLIPMIIWEHRQLFNSSITPFLLDLMKQSINNAIQYLKKNKGLIGSENTKSILLAFAFANPNATYNQLLQVAKICDISTFTMLYLLTTLGNVNHIKDHLNLMSKLLEKRAQEQQKKEENKLIMEQFEKLIYRDELVDGQDEWEYNTLFREVDNVKAVADERIDSELLEELINEGRKKGVPKITDRNKRTSSLQTSHNINSDHFFAEKLKGTPEGHILESKRVRKI